uniref:etoposide-induced protein 2.4 homolog n=1 Tax=Ciona intestinalis TaxID=7719 RepID=UPI00005224A6|nr:etoposide-induced protein 2.4 homolog [Ciona intestinalis]|eukprot:XP_002128342.1 etoposide-induced protein 2.4 homolog [Ciona intestinalis]
MSSVVKAVVFQFLSGIKDSILGVVLIYSLDKNIQNHQRKQQQKAQEENKLNIRRTSSSVENGGKRKNPRVLGRICMSSALASFVWISIWIFSVYVLPMLHYYTKLLISVVLEGEETSKTYEGIWVYVEMILHYTFSALWVLPLYILSKAINGFWFADVSDSVYRFVHGQPRSFPSISLAVADFIYSILVETAFLLQANLVSHIPLEGVNQLLYTMHICMLYALYAFEYKWFNMGIELKLRLQLVDRHWPYFCGFGLPLFIMTNMVFSYYPVVVSACIFSIAFPFFIVSGTQASTPPTPATIQLRIFEPAAMLCSYLFSSSIRSRNSGSVQYQT